MMEKIHDNKHFEKINYIQEEVSYREFESCRFTDCNFSDSSFTNCTFIDCTFDNCNLSNINLLTSSINSVVFENSKLLGIDFTKCNDLIYTASFQKSILDYAIFENMKLERTLFEECELKYTNFAGANLKKARFENCNLLGATFEKTNLSTSDLTTAYNYSIDPEKNNIKQAKFSINGLPGLLEKYKIKVL